MREGDEGKKGRREEGKKRKKGMGEKGGDIIFVRTLQKKVRKLIIGEEK